MEIYSFIVALNWLLCIDKVQHFVCGSEECVTLRFCLCSDFVEIISTPAACPILVSLAFTVCCTYSSIFNVGEHPPWWKCILICSYDICELSHNFVPWITNQAAWDMHAVIKRRMNTNLCFLNMSRQYMPVSCHHLMMHSYIPMPALMGGPSSATSVLIIEYDHKNS